MPPTVIDARRVLLWLAAAAIVLVANAWLATSCAGPRPDNVIPKPVRELIVAHETLTVKDVAAIDSAKRRAAAADRRAAAQAALAAENGRRADSLAALAAAQGDTSTRWKGAYEERTAQVQHLASELVEKETRIREDTAVVIPRLERRAARADSALAKLQAAFPQAKPSGWARFREALRPKVTAGYGVVASQDGEIHHGAGALVGWTVTP